MATQVKTEKIFVYSLIDQFFQRNIQTFKLKSTFKNQICAFKNPQSALFLLAALCHFLSQGEPLYYDVLCIICVSSIKIFPTEHLQRYMVKRKTFTLFYFLLPMYSRESIVFETFF